MFKKTILIAIVAFIFLAAVAFFWQYFNPSPKPSNQTPASSNQSYKFVGQIKNIQGDTIMASGRFFLEDQPAITFKDVQIKTNSNTRFLKTVITTPSPAELAKSKKAWDINSFLKQVQNGNLQDLVQLSSEIHNLDITATSKSDVLNVDQFTAETISYAQQIDAQ